MYLENIVLCVHKIIFNSMMADLSILRVVVNFIHIVHHLGLLSTFKVSSKLQHPARCPIVPYASLNESISAVQDKPRDFTVDL